MLWRTEKPWRRTFLAVALSIVALGPACGVVAQRAGTDARPSSTALPEGSLDLNDATPAQLAALPGMGAAYARRVVEGRPYSAKNQLMTRGILPAAAYEQIKNLVVAHRPPKV